MLILNNGLIVNGDGRTAPFTGSIVIEGSRIAAVGPAGYTGGVGDVVIDAGGRLLMPGAVNPHAHAVAPGPRFASGTPGVSVEEALGNLRCHLAQGHTTVVDLDGFKVPEETALVRGRQPVRVESSTIHFEPMFTAADAVDGAGLDDVHRATTAQKMVATGAVVIGEVGAGMTLGGGGQDYMYIPAALEKATGVRILPAQAKALKYAVLGRHVRPGSPDRQKIADLLRQQGLADLIGVDTVITLIEESVLPSFQVALDGLVASADLALELGVPTLVHNSAPSDEAAREAARIAKELFIGGHTNHGTFSSEEAVRNARWIKEQGGFVEIDTFDAWGRRELHATPEHLIALVQEGLVDIMATDYAAGHWDGMFEMVDAVARVGLAPLEQAVAMATGNVGRALPRVGAERGVLKAGLLADVVISAPRSPAEVCCVVIGGEIALARDEFAAPGTKARTAAGSARG
ncbi:amidohydrolase [Nonomuraea zeae]|uniref:Amidohydrolase n=1 Tax=Nonomuraea zeae TaxID=1642303 RepID=A0A5S4GM58_9ACTN|nr:amidohydrolase [Nonomuraea zeae]TMR33963.1 amidohydrolase [Nonomuraea zeae]